jgi:hypothetical protein
MPKATKKYIVTYSRLSEWNRRGVKATKHSTEVEATSREKAYEKVDNNHRVVHAAVLIPAKIPDQIVADTETSGINSIEPFNTFNFDDANEALPEPEESVPDPIESVDIAETAQTVADAVYESPNLTEELVILIDDGIQTRMDEIEAIEDHLEILIEARIKAQDETGLVAALNEELQQSIVNAQAIEILKADQGETEIESLLDYVPSTTHEAGIAASSAQVTANLLEKLQINRLHTEGEELKQDLQDDIDILQGLRIDLVGEAYEPEDDNEDEPEDDNEDEPEDEPEDDNDNDESLPRAKLPNLLSSIIVGFVFVAIGTARALPLFDLIAQGAAAIVISFMAFQLWDKYHPNE